MKYLRSSAPETGSAGSEGLSYVYVLPCAYEDLLKLGFSRDPLARVQTLHPRYYEFFGLDRGFLIETDTVAEARALELRLRRALAEHNAPAPLTVRRAAGGHTEWYRGAYDALTADMERLAGQGSIVHRPLSAWLRDGLLAQRDLLFSRACALLEGVQGDPDALDRPEMITVRQNALDTLDAYRTLDLPLQDCLPTALLDWYQRSSH
ncbi:GIY-YIG nuclease family protein [Luteimonas gilva]|uniref:GIY-YIG nuclease family protein n=1 Tax=Luteimonas gilva TaxID=2572684 RepID=A0A4U5JUR1_9GAMM|nr:GIY-YIG nuclease family protein [Luteimonas gilva]TKR33285.1 GIY-YIG nuclease family protein [Luteimonas gilva]